VDDSSDGDGFVKYFATSPLNLDLRVFIRLGSSSCSSTEGAGVGKKIGPSAADPGISKA